MYKGSYRGSVVAVKKMRMIARPSTLAAQDAIGTVLENEASRMGSLRHPNTVLFMGACIQDGCFCIVSEYCARGSLYNVLHRQSLTGEDSKEQGRRHHSSKVPIKWNLRLRLALGASRGLLYLHSADPPLVHGQLKSTNILVDDSWNAKLADFGTRRVVETMGIDPQRIEQVSKETGLLRWTAPEVFKLGDQHEEKNQFVNIHTQAIDIYSFGIIMWELTTGEVPYEDLNTNQAIQELVLTGCRPNMTPGLCSMKWAELMARCWSHNPSTRPTAGEIVSTLEEINRIESMALAEKRKARAHRKDGREKRSTKSTSSFRSRTEDILI